MMLQRNQVFMSIFLREGKILSIRSFTDNQKREAYERQSGICVKCNEHFFTINQNGSRSYYTLGMKVVKL